MYMSVTAVTGGRQQTFVVGYTMTRQCAHTVLTGTGPLMLASGAHCTTLRKGQTARFFGATTAQHFQEIPNCMSRNAIRHLLKAYFIFSRHTYECFFPLDREFSNSRPWLKFSSRPFPNSYSKEFVLAIGCWVDTVWVATLISLWFWMVGKIAWKPLIKCLNFRMHSTNKPSRLIAVSASIMGNCEIYFLFIWMYKAGRDSSVGKATSYGLDGPRIDSRWRDFPHPSTPALGPTHPPVQRVSGLSRV